MLLLLLAFGLCSLRKGVFVQFTADRLVVDISLCQAFALKLASLMLWFDGCLFCFHCLDAQDSCLNISRCVVSFGLSGLWWTSHTLEVAIIALV